MTGAQRLVVIDKVSLINFLPVSYEDRIARIPGVAIVSRLTWFGGYYQDPRQQFAQFPVEPDAYFGMYPELVLPEDQMAAWKRDRTGAVIGKDLADSLGIKVGDRIPIVSTIFSKKDGSRSWEFDNPSQASRSSRRG